MTLSDVADDQIPWAGRVLRAWRVYSALTQLELSERLGVTHAAVSAWELGGSGSLPAVDVLARNLGLPSYEREVFAEMTTVARRTMNRARPEWWFNPRNPGAPVWAWIRPTSTSGHINVALEWGAPLHGRINRDVTSAGVFVQFPTSVANPSLHITAERTVWADFGGGTVPTEVAVELGAPVLDAAAVATRSPVRSPPPRGLTREPRLLFGRMREAAEQIGISWNLIIPHLGLWKSQRAPHPVDGTTFEPQATGGPALHDESGCVRSLLLAAPDELLTFRKSSGLSRVAAAERATELDEANPVRPKTIETIEKGRNLPDVTRLIARLDTVYGADGRLGLDRTFDSRPLLRKAEAIAVQLPHYWVGHIWVQAVAPSPGQTGEVHLRWGDWRRRQIVRSGVTVTTRKAVPTESPRLEVRVPAGWHVVAGVGLPPHALDVNRDWHPASPAAAVRLIRNGLNAFWRHNPRNSQR